jgi:NADH:ubiquinone oxidoreductase subunit 6 (subunit J)
VLCLACFTLLFSLRLDNTLTCSYWLVFLPLWVWKATALTGALTGSVSWCRMSRHRRHDRDTIIQLKAMLMALCTNFLIFTFELAVCEKLANQWPSTPWSVCFIPLYALSLISIGSCIWSIRYERSYELELICSLNILQFVFIALRLDNTITWSWVLVLIPVWILMCIALIVLLYLVILTVIITRSSSSSGIGAHGSSSNHHLVQHHNNGPGGGYRSGKQRWASVLLYVVFVFGLIAFEVLITGKLEHEMPPTVHPTVYLSGTGGFYFGSMNSQSSHHQFSRLNSVILTPSLPSSPATAAATTSKTTTTTTTTANRLSNT